MATGCAREWIKFFTGCGIPDDVATMYALVFYENRIKKNMLLDLNKEYLRDMGITVMGDVIAILRYAKLVHKTYVKEQILLDNDDLDEDQKSESCATPKKSMPIKRMLEQYTRKYNSARVVKPKEVESTISNEKNPDVSLETNAKIIPKRKIEIQPLKANAKEKDSELLSPSKVRRVLPETEGDYKIKMPLGTTERSKKILELAKKREAKTVFDRLGESSVSSTTSEISSGNSALSNSSPGNAAGMKEKNLSVFSRLGEKTSVVSSTSSGNQPESVLPYVGILKTEGSQKKGFPTSTMRADNEEQKSVVRKSDSDRGISVKTRLGLTNKESLGAKKAPLQSKTYLQKTGENASKSPIGQVKNALVNASNEKEDQLNRQKIVVSTTQIQNSTNERSLKRKLDTSSSNADGIASKKVRFGTATLRLIPPSSPLNTSSANEVKGRPAIRVARQGRILLQSGALKSDRRRSSSSSSREIMSSSNRMRIKSIGERSKKFISVRDRLG